MSAETIAPEDISTCMEEGRRPRDVGPYRVRIGDADLAFDRYIIEDPVPTGRQIIDTISVRPVEEHIVFQLFRDGDLRELSLDDTVDLRSSEPPRVSRRLVGLSYAACCCMSICS